MNRESAYQQSGVSRGSVDIEFLKASPTIKRRKTNGFRGMVRKLFGRKSVKSQISLPTPTGHLDHDPTDFITSARAVSLPVQHVTRTSALGSHSPFVPLSQREEAQDLPDQDPGPIVSRPRGSSLPGTILNAPESRTYEPVGPDRDGRAGGDQDTHPEKHHATAVLANDEGNIGYAVTSGSNPKRRSRSADGFYTLSNNHRMSPIQWRQWRRRSDEIRYWRESVVESPALVSKFDDHDSDGEEESQQVAPPEVPVRVAEEPDEADEINRDTFDFGILATSMREQETVSMEERVMIMEVKLMDLENAISKMQAHSRSPVRPPQHESRPAVQVRSASASSDPSGTSSLHKQAESSQITQEGSESTQPTSQSSNESPTDRKPRPISNAPTIRPPKAVSPMPSDDGLRQKRNRSSITSLTIDHYTTLISLIRREQTARIRLEEQVSDLQRQVQNLQPPSPQDSRSRLPRWQGNTSQSSNYPHRSHEKLDFRGARYVPDYDDGDTDDGFQEVYQTPTERREFEGGPFSGSYEGEAF